MGWVLVLQKYTEDLRGQIANVALLVRCKASIASACVRVQSSLEARRAEGAGKEGRAAFLGKGRSAGVFRNLWSMYVAGR